LIRFSDKQWDEVRDNYRKWWKGELGRPILPLLVSGADPGRNEPSVPSLSFSNCADFNISPEQIVDRMDYDLSCCEFYGDSYPWINMHHFGPGVAAAFLGAVLEPAEQTVWFHPEKEVSITNLHFTYDPDNVWLKRVKDIYRAGMRRWGGNVCMGMTDLGGVLDILASFVTTEGLLFELLDHPGEVCRLSGEITELWLQFHREITEILKGQQGYSDWSSIYAESPSYMLQCDFCYMIGPDMFQSFVRRDLTRMAGALDRAFYHLDGIGELKHLDSLLAIEALKGIQWIPGAGEPETRDWSEVYAKISGAGKKIQVMYGLEKYLDEIVAVIRRPDDLLKGQITCSANEKTEALRELSRWGAI
jgi:5-methyltetrahydrofolate--homocysteine methyltransferase